MPKNNPDEFYAFDGERLILKNKASKLALEEDFTPVRLPKKPKDGKILQKNYTVRVFAKEGKLTEAFVEKNGVRDGEYKVIDDQGLTKMEMFYKAGKPHGPSVCYFSGGIVAATSWFWEGKQEGLCVWYYPDGVLYAKQRYRNGHLEGLQEFFYPDQTPKTIMYYRKGRLDGKVLVYDQEGMVERSLDFDAGKLLAVSVR